MHLWQAAGLLFLHMISTIEYPLVKSLFLTSAWGGGVLKNSRIEFLRIHRWTYSLTEQHLLEIEIVFTVTFDWWHWFWVESSVLLWVSKRCLPVDELVLEGPVGPEAAGAVVQSLGRFMAAYFTKRPLVILPPHNIDVLPPLHLPHGELRKISLGCCIP